MPYPVRNGLNQGEFGIQEFSSRSPAGFDILQDIK
jgi:hypothetical protein